MDDRVNVLLVDDRPENLLALEAVLEQLNENLVRAESGHAALAAAARGDFAVILMDARMPGLDGYETARLLRDEPRNADTPIIFITANDRDDCRAVSGYAAGAVDYILKPFEPEILRSKVRIFTNLFRKSRQIERQAGELQRRFEDQCELIERNRQLEQKLAERAAEAEQRADLLCALANELTQAEQRERRRLAQVLHDHLQQLLVVTNMKLEILRRRVPEPLQADVREIFNLVVESIKSSRSLTVELSPPILFEGGLIPALEWFGHQVFEKHAIHVETRLSLEGPLPEELRVMLFQIARELVFNAVKYAGVETVTIRLNSADGHVELAVEDEGRGFDPSQLDHCRSRETYGLFSIRERLLLFGGTLAIESRPGEGTRLRVRVPLRTPAHPPPATPLPEAIPAAHVPGQRTADAAGGSFRVLLVDDHRIMREGLGELLRAQPDMEVVGEAFDGAMAVELARSEQPDVVIMDVNMPGVNGIEATRRIRRQFPAIRVIGLSMHNDSAMASTMLNAGAEAHLPKDGPSDALIATIRSGPTATLHQLTTPR